MKLTADSNYGDATITFAETNLAHADLGGSKITANAGYYGAATIDFIAADLTNADLSSSVITAATPPAGEANSTIDFTKATLDNAGMSGSTLTADIVIGLPPLPPAPPSPPSPPPSPPSPPSSPPSPPGTFTSKEALKAAVLAFTENADAAIATYGPVADWDVSGVSDMSELFRNMQNFNEDLSNWDTSGVTDMSYMFYVRSAHAL